VDCAEARKSDFDAPFQQFITEGAWYVVLRGDGLSKRERSIVTIALLRRWGITRRWRCMCARP